MIYIMSCGCEVEGDGIHYKKMAIGKSHTTRRVCKCEKGGQILNRRTQCYDCGCDLVFSKSGETPKRCPEDQKKHHSENVSDSYHLRKKALKNGFIKNNWCKFRNICGGCFYPTFPCAPGEKQLREIA